MTPIDLIKFKLKRRIRGIEIPSGPRFDDPISNDFFLERLSNSNSYLEYGSGGSTFAAAKLGKTFISVESDAYFLHAVLKKIRREIGEPSGKLIHVNIGVTEWWGAPFFKNPTSKRISKWRNYAEAPWLIFPRHEPDLILIDGRFRVLCALVAADRVSNRDAEILIDDYTNREYYREVERFMKLERTIGKMGSFRLKPFNRVELQTSIRYFAADYS